MRGTPPARRTDDADGPRDVLPLRPLDLRLVPAAAGVWAVVLLGLSGGPRAGIVATGAAGVVLVVALGRRGRVAPALVAAAGCAVAAGLLVTIQAVALREHPLRPAAERGAAATVHVVVRDDPRAVRSTAAGGRPGAAQVTVPASLLGAETGRRFTGGGRVLLVAPAEGWATLLPGQRATAEGLLASATRTDLTAAVLRVRGAPTDVGQPPWWQTGAGALRDGLRTAAAVLPEASAGLLPGLAVGDVRGMAAEVDADFRTAGLTQDTLRSTHGHTGASTPR